MSKKKDKTDQSPRIANRKAHHDYHILEKLECGIALQGSEVKSVRNGQVSLAEGYARVEPRDENLYLYNVDIASYPHAGVQTHEPKRVRRLLAHRREIDKLMGMSTTKGKGLTIIPLAMYFVRGFVKVEIGLAQGKDSFDKRQDIKTREAKRDIQRGMTRKVI